MAKTSNAITIPDAEFKQVFEAATADAAFDAITEAKEGVLMLVPMEAIHPIAGFNIRVHTPDYEAFIERLKESMIANSFFRHRPLKVHPTVENGQPLLYLADGYSRYEAAKRAIAAGAKFKLVPVVATPKGTSMDDLFVGLDADNDSRPLSAFEKGINVKRMLADGNDEDEVANKLRITKQYVNDLMLLMGAPKGLHNMVVAGKVAASLAIDLIKEHGSGAKALAALKDADKENSGGEGEEGEGGGDTGNRVTRSQVSRTGGTAKAGKKLYEALIEYLIVLNSGSGAQSAIDFLLKWHEKDADAVKELAKLVGKKSKKTTKPTKPDKDTRISIKKSMSEEEKEKARKHNKRVKLRAEKAAKAAAAAAAAGTPAAETPPPAGSDDDPV